MDKQAKLDVIAANAKRSRSYVANEAIDHYLDLYEWQTRRIEERLEKAQIGDARWMSHDDVFDRLEAKIKDRLERGQCCEALFEKEKASRRLPWMPEIGEARVQGTVTVA